MVSTLKVCEIFTSIQGESSYAGVPCAFIRLTGCNLRCTYCDTKYAYDEGVELTLDEVAQKATSTGTKLVEITGGEPLMQQPSIALAERLSLDGLTVLVETNGSLDISPLKGIPGVTVIMDLKTPSSGMSAHNDYANIARLTPEDEVKFVIGSRDDYTWAAQIIRRYEIDKKCLALMSPAETSLTPKVLTGWILEDKLDVRLNVQIHKYIFGPNQRGV
ncbi:MAG: radical SAM protein [Nitrospirae bacterium]|nr:radical SAM protein [Nitrospirota bacterium]